jgi:hypothetical protein
MVATRENAKPGVFTRKKLPDPREEREPNFRIPFLSSALGKRWRNSAVECLHLIARLSREAQHRI